MRFLLMMSLLPVPLLAELPPKGITVSQWVREDYFAAYLGKDMASFAKGEAKAMEIMLATDDAEARAWVASGKLFLAARAYQAGNKSEAGALLFDEAMEGANRALFRKNPSAMRILAASYVLFADRFPGELRERLYRDGRTLFIQIRQQEGAGLDRLPLHMKGEVLAGQAQAAMKLGLQEEATRHLREIVEKLPDTHYAQTAEKWLADPASAVKGQLVCQSCHEPNRLANRLKAIAAVQ